MKQIVLKTTLGLFGVLLLSSGALAQTTSVQRHSRPVPTDGDWHVVCN